MRLHATHRSYLSGISSLSLRPHKGMRTYRRGITDNLPRILPAGAAARSTAPRGACRRSSAGWVNPAVSPEYDLRAR